MIAAIVFLVAASGGLLLLREPYYRTVHPSLAAPVAVPSVDTRAAALADVEARFGSEGIRLLKFPRDGVNAYQLWFFDGSEAFVASDSRSLIARWHWSTSLPAFLFELHAHLLVDGGGTVVNGVLALILIFMALTGVVVWWPRKSVFRLRRVAPRSSRPGEVLRSHAAVGMLATVPIVLFAMTGAAIVFYEPTSRVLSAMLDRRAPEEPTVRVAPLDAPHRPWTEILAALDRTFPEGETVFLYPGTSGNARLLFRKRLPGEWHPNGRSYVVIDPYTARVVQAIDARAQGMGTRVMQSVYPVHAASVGGAGMTALAGMTAIALSWLAGGGVWAYLARRVRRTRQAARAEACRPNEPESAGSYPY